MRPDVHSEVPRRRYSLKRRSSVRASCSSSGPIWPDRAVCKARRRSGGWSDQPGYNPVAAMMDKPKTSASSKAEWLEAH